MQRKDDCGIKSVILLQITYNLDKGKNRDRNENKTKFWLIKNYCSIVDNEIKTYSRPTGKKVYVNN